jgi:hypothetical protein
MCFIESRVYYWLWLDIERKRLLLLSQSIRGRYIVENDHTETFYEVLIRPVSFFICLPQ